MIPRPRAAHPADGPACIPLIAEAGGELLAWAVGWESVVATGLLERCWTRSGHPLGPATTTVIEVEDTVAGLIVGDAVPRWLKAERRRPVSLAGLTSPGGLRAIEQRLARQRAARPPLPDDGWYLSSLGVHPTFRRRGLARLLLAEAATLARARGCRGLSVEVVASNTPARALYASDGFVEQLAWRPDGGPEVVRLWRGV